MPETAEKPVPVPAELKKPLPPAPAGKVRAVVLRAFPAAIEDELATAKEKNSEIYFANPANRMISDYRYDKKGNPICRNVILMSTDRFKELSQPTIKNGITLRLPLVRAFEEGPDNVLLTTLEAPKTDRHGRLLSDLPPSPADEIQSLRQEVAELKSLIASINPKK